MTLAAQIDSHAPPSLRRLLPKLVSTPIGIDSIKDRSAARATLHAAIDLAAARAVAAAAKLVNAI